MQYKELAAKDPEIPEMPIVRLLSETLNCHHAPPRDWGAGLTLTTTTTALDAEWGYGGDPFPRRLPWVP